MLFYCSFYYPNRVIFPQTRFILCVFTNKLMSFFFFLHWFSKYFFINLMAVWGSNLFVLWLLSVCIGKSWWFLDLWNGYRKIIVWWRRWELWIYWVLLIVSMKALMPIMWVDCLTFSVVFRSAAGKRSRVKWKSILSSWTAKVTLTGHLMELSVGSVSSSYSINGSITIGCIIFPNNNISPADISKLYNFPAIIFFILEPFHFFRSKHCIALL